MQPIIDADLARIQEQVIQAASRLVEYHGYLLEYNVNERSITHKFAELLQREFPEWDVDCEYNRNHDEMKTLDLTNEEYATQIALPPRNDISSSDLNATTVFPDIIVHKRGTGRNLVVIEVKKSTNRESDDWDLAKLKAFKSELHYDVAMFFRFRIGAKDGKFDDPIIL